MAQRAAERATARRAEQITAEAREWAEFRRREERDAYTYFAATMTLGEAVGLLRSEPVGCACHGGIACCKYTYAAARRLQRAAHITAKLLADPGWKL